MTLRNSPAERVADVERSRASEQETLFLGLVRDYHRKIYNFVFRMVGDPDLAEDLTQEAYLRAYRGLAKLPPGANHRAWLYRIASNAATDELRRRKRRPQVSLSLVPNLRAPADSEERKLGRVVIDDALMAISPSHRMVLTLFEFGEFTAPEVGEVLGITPAAARKRRQRARQALARALEDER